MNEFQRKLKKETKAIVVPTTKRGHISLQNKFGLNMDERFHLVHGITLHSQ